MLGESRRQIEAGIDQRRIERDRLLEVIDGLFVLGVLVSLHAFIELVAGLAACRNLRWRAASQRDGQHYQHSCVVFIAL